MAAKLRHRRVEKLGRGVIEHLIADQKISAKDIIAVTRDPAKLGDLAARGVDVRQGDPAMPARWPSAFCRRRARAHHLDRYRARFGRARQAAQRGGGRCKGGGRVARALHLAAEARCLGDLLRLRASRLGEGADRQRARLHHLPQRLVFGKPLHVAPQALKSGQWFTSAGDGKLSAYTSRDDFAAAIAGGLASDEPGNRIHTLTGSELFTTAEIAALASKILGKPISVVQVTDEQLAAGFASTDCPSRWSPWWCRSTPTARGGFLDLATDDIETLSGRKSQTLRELLEATTGCWRCYWKKWEPFSVPDA